MDHVIDSRRPDRSFPPGFVEYVPGYASHGVVVVVSQEDIEARRVVAGLDVQERDKIAADLDRPCHCLASDWRAFDVEIVGQAAIGT